jgi:UDP-N-acetylglucosamine 1-carboxyvinyltransferase
VTELINMLNKMGARISIYAPMTLVIQGTSERFLQPITYEIMPDRLEVGTLLLASAITQGEITLTNGCPDKLDVFLAKLDEMGHSVSINDNAIHFKATLNPRAVSFVTMPYPGFPTDLQPMMMAALACADGESVVTETVYDNRFLHVEHLNKMGADIKVQGHRAYIKGVDELYGTSVIATDIRASASLLLAGLKARGETVMSGVYHLKRGYQNIEEKLKKLGAKIGCNNS